MGGSAGGGRQAPEIKGDYSVKRGDYNIYPRSSWPIENLEKPARGAFEWRICRAGCNFSSGGAWALHPRGARMRGSQPLSVSDEFDSAVRKLSRFRGWSARPRLDKPEKCVIARKPPSWTSSTDQSSRDDWIRYRLNIIRGALCFELHAFVPFSIRRSAVIERNYVSNAFTKALFIHDKLLSI